MKIASVLELYCAGSPNKELNLIHKKSDVGLISGLLFFFCTFMHFKHSASFFIQKIPRYAKKKDIKEKTPLLIKKWPRENQVKYLDFTLCGAENRVHSCGCRPVTYILRINERLRKCRHGLLREARLVRRQFM